VKGKIMKFGEALTLLNAGHPVTRHGWNGKGMFLIRAGGYMVEADKVKPNGPINAEFLKRRGLTHLEILPHIDMWTVNSEGRQAYLPGWLASQSDMLADDWMEYKEPVEEEPHRFTLSSERVQALKLAGFWNDSVKRDQMIRKYADLDRESKKHEEESVPTKKPKKLHWTQTAKGRKIMANRKPRGSKK
jgi:hypothetical protein